MTEALMLALPNFAVPFTIETETSNWEMDALWQQEGHPLAFISKAFDPRSQKTINLWQGAIGNLLYSREAEELFKARSDFH